MLIVLVVVSVGLLYWFQFQNENSETTQREHVQFPIEVSSLGGVDLTSADALTIILTINCQLSSLDPGCGAEPLFASQGACEWENDALNFVSHKIFNSGYEEAHWELRLWEEGPVAITIADHLPTDCSTDPNSARSVVGSIHIGHRQSLD